jgi:hypothetical protein
LDWYDWSRVYRLTRKGVTAGYAHGKAVTVKNGLLSTKP